jgi:hypothetical protein
MGTIKVACRAFKKALKTPPGWVPRLPGWCAEFGMFQTYDARFVENRTENFAWQRQSREFVALTGLLACENPQRTKSAAG